MSRHAMVVALLAAVMAPAWAEVGPLDVQLNHLHLHWALAEGLSVTCDGRPMLAGQAAPVVAYPPGWGWSYSSASVEMMTAKLTTQGGRKVMTIECRDPKLQWRETITCGPGDRFTIAYAYTQDAWDQQMKDETNLTRPEVGWMVGATWKATAGGKTTTGQIPPKFGGVSNPFTNARQIEIDNLFGKITIASTRGLTLYDYANRSQFWLGLDGPLPRKAEQKWSADFAYEPMPLEVGGVKVSDLRFAETADGERAEMSLGLSRLKDGPAKVTARLVADVGQPSPVDEKEVALAAKPSPVKFAVMLPGPGRYNVHLELAADGKTIYKSQPLSVVAPQLLSIAPGRTPFMTGDYGTAILRVKPDAGANLYASVASGTTRLAEGPVTAGERSIMPIDLTVLPNGMSQLTAVLSRNGQPIGSASCDVIYVPRKANAVVLDNLSHAMIVNGMPFCPQSCYTDFGIAQHVAETEAPLGFNTIAPYMDSNIAERRKMRDQVRALLDRCAQIGMYVNLDLRAASHPPQTAETWAWLKEEVEAFRDSPALLSYYLADEPELGWAKPENCIAAYKRIKALDPYHPVTMVFCTPGAAASYAPGMDVVMTDPYPIPNGPVTRVADYIDRIRSDTGDRLPLWVVPQAFGGGEGWAREPSRQEERVMTYLALIHGARGVQYFIRRPPASNPNSPDLWSECRRLMLELSQLTPALASDEDAPKVTCAQPNVQVAAFRERGAITVLAANVENKPMPMQISLGVPFTGEAKVMFDNRSVPVNKGKIDDLIDGMSTRVYRMQVAPPPADLAKIDPRNLTVNPSFEDAHNVGTPDGCYVGFPPDKAASWYVDPRTAANGRQSLRLRTPTDGQSMHIAPFPVSLAPGKKYRLSVWAKGEHPGMKFSLSLDAVQGDQATHEMTTDWKEYSVDFTASPHAGRGSPSLRLPSAGWAWFDALQVIPLD